MTWWNSLLSVKRFCWGVRLWDWDILRLKDFTPTKSGQIQNPNPGQIKIWFREHSARHRFGALTVDSLLPLSFSAKFASMEFKRFMIEGMFSKESDREVAIRRMMQTLGRPNLKSWRLQVWCFRPPPTFLMLGRVKICERLARLSTESRLLASERKWSPLCNWGGGGEREVPVLVPAGAGGEGHVVLPAVSPTQTCWGLICPSVTQERQEVCLFWSSPPLQSWELICSGGICWHYAMLLPTFEHCRQNPIIFDKKRYLCIFLELVPFIQMTLLVPPLL